MFRTAVNPYLSAIAFSEDRNRESLPGWSGRSRQSDRKKGRGGDPHQNYGGCLTAPTCGAVAAPGAKLALAW